MNSEQIQQARQIAEQQIWHAFRSRMEHLAQTALKAALHSQPEASAEWRAAIGPLFLELARLLQALSATAETAATWPPQGQS